MATDSGNVRMPKDINLTSASAIMTGIIIGSGIFVSPVSFIRNCGSIGVSLIMWIASGVLSLGVALCFNELGAIFPRSGGEYTFFKQTLGPLPAFVDAWHQFVMIQPSFQALLALTTVDYLVQAIFPGSCDVPQIAVKIFTIWIIITMVMVNSSYVKHVARIQTFLTAVKILTLVFIIVTGLVQLGLGKTEILKSGFEGTNHDPGSHAIAVHSGIFTYMGWQYIFCLMDEVKDPERIVPRATLISLLSVTVLYTLTNVAYFTVLTPQEMMTSKAVALTFAEKTVGRFSVVMPAMVACSTISSLNGAILGGSRYYYAAARDGLFPSLMSTVHVKYLTPWPSLFGVTLVSVAYVVTGEAVALLEYLGFGATAMLFVAVGCLLYLRWSRPKLERPFKVHIAIPVICVILLGCLVVLGVYQSPKGNGIAILLVATGIPVYYVFVIWVGKLKTWNRKMYKLNCWVQKCLKVVPTEKSS